MKNIILIIKKYKLWWLWWIDLKVFYKRNIPIAYFQY